VERLGVPIHRSVLVMKALQPILVGGYAALTVVNALERDWLNAGINLGAAVLILGIYIATEHMARQTAKLKEPYMLEARDGLERWSDGTFRVDGEVPAEAIWKWWQYGIEPDHTRKAYANPGVSLTAGNGVQITASTPPSVYPATTSVYRRMGSSGIYQSYQQASVLAPWEEGLVPVDEQTAQERAHEAYDTATERCVACTVKGMYQDYICPRHRRMRERIEEKGLWA
jgi:hypothetical protein